MNKSEHFLEKYNTKYQENLIGSFKFELKSLYGRVFLVKKPRIKDKEKNYLQLGCGLSKLNGWVNADFFVANFKFWKKLDNKPDWMLDLRFPLNCDNDIWDGVFTEHTLEHLYPNQTLALLKELNRTMKKNAWLRVTVPDVEKYVRYYQEKEGHQEFYRWQTGCEAIHSLTQNYGHKSVWDSELLGHFLQEAGFINIKKVSFKEGTDKALLQDREERKWETLYIECQKPGKA